VTRHRFALALTILALAAAPADTFKVVPPSAVEFTVTRKDVPHAGRFKKVTGTIDLPGGDLAKIKLALELRCDTLTADGDRLTAQLKSADFFDVGKHPTATLTTTAARPVHDDAGHTHLLTADLTLHGVTKPVTIPIHVERAEPGVRLEGKFRFNRKEFGMTGGEFGNDVTVKLTLQAGK
jgi:polyisoprenoid-binding protein YceI